MKITIEKLCGWATITLGLFAILYGASEFMHTIRVSQNILNEIIKVKPELFNNPSMYAFIKIAMDQALSMKVIAFIAPGFILSALGLCIVYLAKILEKINIFLEVLNSGLEIFNDDSDNHDEKLTDDLQNETIEDERN